MTTRGSVNRSSASARLTEDGKQVIAVESVTSSETQRDDLMSKFSFTPKLVQPHCASAQLPGIPAHAGARRAAAAAPRARSHLKANPTL